jgi:aminopeptidase N
MPLGGCTGMVNLDTVGRLSDGPLTVFGTNTARELPHVIRGVNYGAGFELEMPEEDPGGSDQSSFVGRGVPAVQIFTGAHADYHRPGDTADKVDFEGLERIAEFTTELAIYLADRDEPMAFIPPGADKAAAAAPSSGGSGRRVSFGSIPDFNYTGDGVRVSGVIPESPAAQAGLKEGDLLVEFAGIAVDDLRSFSGILKGLSPGDEVDVVYLRDGERHTATVTVVERK